MEAPADNSPRLGWGSVSSPAPGDKAGQKGFGEPSQIQGQLQLLRKRIRVRHTERSAELVALPSAGATSRSSSAPAGFGVSGSSQITAGGIGQHPLNNGGSSPEPTLPLQASSRGRVPPGPGSARIQPRRVASSDVGRSHHHHSARQQLQQQPHQQTSASHMAASPSSQSSANALDASPGATGASFTSTNTNGATSSRPPRPERKDSNGFGMGIVVPSGRARASNLRAVQAANPDSPTPSSPSSARRGPSQGAKGRPSQDAGPALPRSLFMVGLDVPGAVAQRIAAYAPVSAIPALRRVCLLFHCVMTRMLSRDPSLKSAVDSILEGKRVSCKRVWVVVRTRPYNEGPGCVRINRNLVKVNASGTTQGYEFYTDCAFDGSATQAQVCDFIGSKTLPHALNGEHVCLMAYGQTGSGKTHTMFGSLEANNPEQQGMAFRAVATLAHLLREGGGIAGLSVDFSFLEVYNDELYDLLDGGKKLPKQRSSEKHVVPTGLTRRGCDAQDMEKQVSVWIREGAATRTVGKTVFNPRSSRSHGVVLLHLKWGSPNQFSKSSSRLLTSSNAGIGRAGTETRIYLVDLAGSERAGLYATDKEQLKEGEYINLSLSALGRVVGALATGKAKHVPYRDSALTWLLKDAITGSNARVCMVAAIHPAHGAESASTLRYAHSYSSMQSSSGTRVPDLTAEARELKRRVDNLRNIFQKAMEGDEYGIAWTMESLSGTVQPTKTARDLVERHPYLTWTQAHQTKWATRGQRRDRSFIGRARTYVDVPEPRGANEPPDGRLTAEALAVAMRGVPDGEPLERCVEVVFESRHGRPPVVLWYPEDALEEVLPPKNLLDAKANLQRAEEELSRKKAELKAAQEFVSQEKKEWHTRQL